MVGNWKQHQNAHQQMSELTNQDIYKQWDTNQEKEKKKGKTINIQKHQQTQNHYAEGKRAQMPEYTAMITVT